ncbi:MAG: hypothetical protein QMD22_04930 [archaeon]|nr:hypothetical protein [archaeon]
MRAKVFLALFLVALLLILVSTVSASTTDRTYTKTGGVITCDSESPGTNKFIKDEIEAGNPIFVVYKGEKISFKNSTGYEMTEIRIDGIFTSTGVSSSNFKTSFISTEWDTEGKYEGYYRFSNDTNRNGVYFENMAYLFSIDKKVEGDLNNGTIPGELKDRLKEKGYLLSENTTIERKAKYEWLIIDRESRDIYVASKESYEDKTNIYISAIDYQGWLTLDTHTFRLDLEPTDKTYRKGSLILRIASNNKEAGFMKFTIESQGHSIRDINGTDIYEIPIEYNEETKFWNISEDISGVDIQDGTIVLNMSGLDVEEGRYTITLEDFATGVEKKLNFEIKARELEIDTSDTVIKGEIAEITVKSAFSGKDVRLYIDGVPKENVTLNKEGEKRFRWDTSGVHVGKHNIRIEVDVDGDGEFKGLEDEVASRYIELVEGEVSIELSSDTVMIGDPVKISGKSNYGSYAVIVIDGKYVEKAKITRGKFESEYKTVGEMEGTKKIEVFIAAPIEFGSGEEVSEDWKLRNGADADAEFTLIESKVLTLDLPAVIAEGDDVLIKGTASGTDKLYLLVLNGKGEVIFPYEGVAIATAVRDNSYKAKLIKPDVGVYTVIVLHEGRDGVTDAISAYDGKWVIGDEPKTLDLRIAIVEDAIEKAGSDDIFMKKEFKVVNPEVKLALEDATFGESLTIIATTNVKEGTMAWISMEKEGSGDKEIKTVKVNNGRITAEFDTNTLSVGRWKVGVNIPDRCSDEGVITIQGQASIPASTATPIATVMPSSSSPPISAAEEETGTQIPGFELISSLAVLIAVAYVRRAKARGHRDKR